MSQKILQPKEVLNKAFRRVKPIRSNIESFKANLIRLLEGIHEGETEEFHKNLVIEFLKNTWYQPNYSINTKGRNDLVIHNGKDAKSTVGVLIEAKKPSNKSEMLRKDHINCKALQELLLYYLRERITSKNLEIKYIAATNILEWFIFDAALFEKYFAHNTQLIKLFVDFEEGRLAGATTEFFYKEIAQPAIKAVQENLTYTYFDIRDYDNPLRNNNPIDDNKLIVLYKLLSPEHLLKLPFINDSNSLDKAFYGELLHIIGLAEIKDKGKKLINRKEEGKRNPGSLLENAIGQLDSRDKIGRLEKPLQFGSNYQERLYNVGLELVITWINRILFLKLLEGQLITYHRGDKSFAFLHKEKIQNYDDLDHLFFSVLAKKEQKRDDEVKLLFSKVPYLNSSLFEPTDLEQWTIFISNLRDERKLPIYSGTVLKDATGRRRTGEVTALEYLFEFLNAYDFSSEGGEEIQEDNKSLINASVLGLIFEKINGYKDGSFFTPGFITMYMCRETIRRAVLQKFKEAKGWECENLDQLYDKIDDKKEANAIINSLHICDPAVGSGHFLVSALNEIIAIKSELKILVDRQGKTLRDYHVLIENDELMVTDDNGDFFAYHPKNTESQRVQETLFHEKQTIIEECLFGVDINPNSVKICRLRLWIELLKNAYYKPGTNELETLPNIDINIKCGNSLISRYGLDTDLKQALKASKSKWNITTYRNAVKVYRNASGKEEKREMERLIADIKTNFRSEISKNDLKVIRLYKFKGELFNLTSQTAIFGMTPKEKAVWEKGVNLKTIQIEKLEIEIEEIKNNKIYENAFEWRFEFPEVLNDEGDFVGFDVVIGNPPYFSLSKDPKLKVLQDTFDTFDSTGDIYCLFYEKGNQILKNKGILYFITSNKWMRAVYGKKLRHFLVHNTNPIFLFDFSWYQVFENASVDSNLLGFTKEMNHAKVFAGVAEKDFAIEKLESYIDTKSVYTYFPDNDYWTIKNNKYTNFKRKIAELGIPLSKWGFSLYRGILTGLNEAFIIDKKTKDDLIHKDSKNNEIIKPLIRGRDVERYGYNFQQHYLIFTRRGIQIDNYPSIKNYLLKYKEDLMPKASKNDIRGRKPGSYNWYEIQDSIAYYQEFDKEKLIWAETMRVHKTGDRNFPRFGYDKMGYYTDKTVFIGVGSHLKYLLAFLNSSVGKWLIMEYVTKLDTGGYMMQKIFLDKIPVIVPSTEHENRITDLVDRILKAEENQAEVILLEKEIDALVYQLYGFTEDEINIIEDK